MFATRERFAQMPSRNSVPSVHLWYREKPATNFSKCTDMPSAAL
jgi:hypothetical protein